MVEDLWYKNTLIYSLDLETFMDADGDGVGDFEGLMWRLDYLHSLGVETLWLAPFHPSPYLSLLSFENHLPPYVLKFFGDDQRLPVTVQIPGLFHLAGPSLRSNDQPLSVPGSL